MDSDSSLLNELREDVKLMSTSITKLSVIFERWSPVWEQQVHGLSDLTNRQTKFDGRMDNLEERFSSDKEYRNTLESLAKDGANERSNALRWTIGIGVSIIGLLLTILTYVSQHVVIK